MTGALARSVEPEPHQHLVGGGTRRPRSHAEEPPVEVQVLPHGERAVERVGLRHHPDQLLGDCRVRDHVDVADVRLPCRGDRSRREHARGRGLAGAVRAEQAEDLALEDREVEAVHRLHRARVDLGQADGADDRRAISRQRRHGDGIRGQGGGQAHPPYPGAAHAQSERRRLRTPYSNDISRAVAVSRGFGHDREPPLHSRHGRRRLLLVAASASAR